MSNTLSVDSGAPTAAPASFERTTPGLLRRIFDHPVFILPRDFRLFLLGARTDAAIKPTHAISGARAAFEDAYPRSDDPWASAAPRFRYQQRKYEQIMAL